MSRILIVDDDPQGLYMLEALLKGHGHEVTTAVNGADALEKARRDPPDAIISDFFMPTMDGFALCRECKRDDRLRDVPFIAYTATYTDPRDEELAMGLGAVRFLIKPIEPEALLREVDQVFADAKAGRLAPRSDPAPEEQHLREYNAALIRKLEAKVAQSQEANLALQEEMAQRKRAEEELRRSHDELERRVAERTAELERRADQLSRLASELTLTEQRERQRLAQMLHDHLQQLLVGAKFGLELLSKRLTDGQRPFAEQVAELLDEAIASSRSLTAELSPPILRDAGLAAGLEWLARWMQTKHGLAVDLVVASNACRVPEDVKVLMFQSVRELLFNVVKHAGVTSARVELAQQDPEHVKVVVSDEGVGFRESDVSQPDLLTSGFGLLSIRERLHLLRGCLDVVAAPGQGARITLSAPCQEAAAAAASEAPPLPESARTDATGAAGGGHPPDDRIHILLVDDHVVMRQGLSSLLGSEPDLAVIGEASDGQEAVELARLLRPDVILMDSSMPRMDGVQATRIIRAEQPDVRIIGLSMYDQADRAAAMLNAGANAYLSKSGRPEILLASIRGRVSPVTPSHAT